MNYFHALREYATPIAVKSTFVDSGRITPEEFVKAGDFLVHKCPTWKWSGGDRKKRRDYLPADKQYLVTRNVPCTERVDEGKEAFPEHQEGDWTVFEEPPESITANIPVDIDETDDDVDDDQKDDQIDHERDEDEQDAGEGQDFVEDDGFYDAGQDECYVEDTIRRTRTYDVYITWDKYWQTPRVWLFGFNESRVPLGRDEMFMDISAEHAKKTVTYEPHPHENIPSMSIHPCKHAHVMAKLINSNNSNSDEKKGKKEVIRVEQYLVLFLKFIGTVIPTISYDYSMSV